MVGICHGGNMLGNLNISPWFNILLTHLVLTALFLVLETEGPSCLGRESRAGTEIVFKLEFGVLLCLGGSDRPPSGLARLGCLLLLLRDLQGAPEEHAGQGGGRRMAS